jgi:hypothetical protein
MPPFCVAAGLSRSRLALTEGSSVPAGQTSHSRFTTAKNLAPPHLPGYRRKLDLRLRTCRRLSVSPAHAGMGPGAGRGTAGCAGRGRGLELVTVEWPFGSPAVASARNRDAALSVWPFDR